MTGTESRRVEPGAGGRGGSEELLFDEYKMSVFEDERVLEMDGGDDCRTVWMYSMPLNRIQKW